MIYAVYSSGHGKTYYPLVSSILKKPPPGKPVVLNGMMDVGMPYEKTGPYCPIRYEAPPGMRGKKPGRGQQIQIQPKAEIPWSHKPPPRKTSR
jgi:hypothetical protein